MADKYYAFALHDWSCCLVAASDVSGSRCFHWSLTGNKTTHPGRRYTAAANNFGRAFAGHGRFAQIAPGDAVPTL
jgi:hypothetical protein